MNKSTIKYIIENILDDELNIITPLSNCAYIVITKQECKFLKTHDYHFMFDHDNELLRVYPVRLRHNQPEDGIYYINIDNIYYEYLTDNDGNPVCDYYPYDQIQIFKLWNNYEKDPDDNGHYSKTNSAK